MKKVILNLSVFCLAYAAYAQEAVEEGPALVSETFNSSRIISGHSVETLEKKEWEYRIEHRFGNIGTGSGVDESLGFDQAADIRFAFEYGITDKLMVGLARDKGSTTAYRSIVDGFIKYRLLQQTEKGMPLSMTVIGSSLISYAKATSDISAVSHYPKFAHRLAYSTQLNIARKFSEHISFSLMPTWVHRNYVASYDVNDLFALGAGLSVKLTKKWAFISEYYHTFHESTVLPDLQNSLGFGVEWKTYGHNFHLTMSNSSLFNEAQFIPFTTEKWGEGQFRIGFSITRSF
ncbi:MAG: hypothetical protein K0R65_914 [Crocinitomicaceae bacterium]|jgi:opacity protein-like surface antigen|nr:hypothetical protein [Crocinitomicaceae bacterium]